MNKYYIDLGDLTSLLTMSELATVNKLKKKISLLETITDLKNNEVSVSYKLENTEYIIYYIINEDSISYIDDEISDDKYPSNLIKIASLQLFSEANNQYLFLNKTSSSNRLISNLVADIMSSEPQVKKYQLEPIIDLTTNTVKFKISSDVSKSYVIKDLYSFSYLFKTKADTTYNNLEVKHDVNYFKSEIIFYVLKLITDYHIKMHQQEYNAYFKHKTNKLILTDEEIYNLIILFEKVNINSTLYQIRNLAEKLVINVKGIDENYIVEFENNVQFNNYFYYKINNNTLCLHSYKDYNLKKLFDTFKLPQLASISELFDLYNVINQYYDELIYLDFDYRLFEDYQVSEIDINLKKEHNDIIFNITLDDNSLIDNSRFKAINAIMHTYEKINNQTYLIKEKDIFNFFKYSIIELQKNVDNIYYDEQTSKLQITQVNDLAINLENKNGKLNLKYLSPSLTEEQIKLILNSSDNYYKLDENTIIDLTTEAFKSLREIDQLVENNTTSTFNNLFIETFAKKNKIKINSLTKVEKIKQYNEILSFELRDYQQQGLDFLYKLHNYNINGLLADDMGLGKTIQVLSLLNYLKSDLPHLIVVPASLIYNWESEIKKFSPGLKTLLYQGSKRKSLIKDFAMFDIIITNYELIRNDIAEFKDLKFSYVILDEAQYIKNIKAKTRDALTKLTSEHKLCLTGTPIENNLDELYSIIDYLNPGYLGTHKQYKALTKNMLELSTFELLKKRLSVIMLRRIKSDVLKDLPEKQILTIKVKMSTLQRALYDEKLNELQNNSSITNKIEILSYITKLRQICTNPGLIDKKYQELSPKYEVLIDKLQTLIENNHKTIVFTQFTKNFSFLEQLFTENNISYYKISGKTQKSLRQSLVNKFNNDDTNVMLISLKAGGSGLNIVGADTVIHLDPWWNSAVENQANDRVHRIGQTKNVNIYKLITNDSIEENINEIQDTKNKLSNNILEFDENILSLNTNEILEIIKGE